MLEAEDTRELTGRLPGSFDGLPASAEERAIFRFSGSILARSATHRLFLASYREIVGIAIGLLTTVTVSAGRQMGLSPDGLLAASRYLSYFSLCRDSARPSSFPPNSRRTGCFELQRNDGRRSLAAHRVSACWRAGYSRRCSYFFRSRCGVGVQCDRTPSTWRFNWQRVRC